jgi:hypothetical protein
MEIRGAAAQYIFLMAIKEKSVQKKFGSRFEPLGT